MRSTDTDTELLFIDIPYQFRTIIFPVIKLEFQVIGSIQIFGIFDFDRFIRDSSFAYNLHEASIPPFLVGRQLHLIGGLQYIQSVLLFDYHSTMAPRRFCSGYNKWRLTALRNLKHYISLL